MALKKENTKGKAVFEIFSDGASFNNGRRNPDRPQRATMGIVLTMREKPFFEYAKDLGDATISVGELTGVITAITLMKERCDKINGMGKLSKPYRIKVYSDSEYVIKGISERIKDWVKRGWKVKSGSDVANKELWKELLELKEHPDLDLSFHHVKGHTGAQDFHSRMNDRCDKLATDLMKQWKKENGYK